MRTIENEATPVLVLGSNAHWGLGIFRSLGRMRIPVYARASDSQAPALFSRYCRKKCLCDTEEFSEQTLRDLINIGSKIGRKSILIPTTDQGAIFVADHAGALDEWFMFPKQSSDLVRSLCSKKQMYNLAKKSNFPTPEATFPQCKQDVLDFLRTASFPIMIKAIHGWRLLQRNMRSVVIVNTERELVEKYDEMEEPEEPNLMLQEYIPGGDDTVWMFNGYFNEQSDCLFNLTGRKIRMWPVHQGVNSLGICLRNDVVEKKTIEFMRTIGYRGIVDIGYRFDVRDRQYKVLDINPRIGATFRLFVDNDGMDVARALYLDMTGQSKTARIASDGRKWLVEDLDLGSSVLCLLDRSQTPRQWINSYRGVREAAYFALDDPLPFLKMLQNHVGGFKSIVNALNQGRRT
jgi:D-aspartate ligase